jgi:choline dehydrogenase
MVSLGGGYLSAPQIVPDDEIAAFLQNISQAVAGQSWTPGFDLQSQLILNDLNEGQEMVQHMNVVGGMNPDNETGTAPPQHGFSVQVCGEHMFSRGSTHIKSNNASEYPIINPNWFSNPADFMMLGKAAMHVQNVLGRTPPLSDYLQGNGTVLGPLYVNLTDDNYVHVIKQQGQSVEHPCGTCAMMPQEAGGVVDARFKVYGVSNLRVIDASIFPLIPRGNLQTCVYAVAERGADFVKVDHGLPV